jgi:prolyl 4-hydroxylase
MDPDRSLDDWLRQSIERGCTIAAMVDTMVASGHTEARASLTVLGAFARWQPAALGLDERATAPPPADRPGTPLVADSRLTLDGRNVDVALVCDPPRLAVLDGLLDGDECATVVAAARGRLEPSCVVGEGGAPGRVDPSRTSSGTALRAADHATVGALRRRVVELVGLPDSHLEPVQVLRYRPGDAYAPHDDYFEPDSGDIAAGQRVATVIVYLNDVAAGGATVFGDGWLRITPRPGRAVWFTYRGDGSAGDVAARHAGAPVEDGEKWIATLWCRDRPYGPGPGSGSGR